MHGTQTRSGAMEKSRILVIEDNQDTRQFLETVLSREFEVFSTQNAVAGIEYARTKQPDLIILDIMLPVLNGFDACGLLKKDEATRNIPIIFLSAKNTANDIAHGFGLGADDYLPKPFDYKELIARVRARLREKSARQKEPKTLVDGEIKLVLDTRDAFHGGSMVSLTQIEFDLLSLLLRKRGQVISRDEIIQLVWREDPTTAHKRTIDVHIRALRKKIPVLTRMITSIYGVGYKYGG